MAGSIDELNVLRIDSILSFISYMDLDRARNLGHLELFDFFRECDFAFSSSNHKQPC